MIGNVIGLITLAAMFGLEARKAVKPLPRLILWVLTAGFLLSAIFIKWLEDFFPRFVRLLTDVFSQPLAWFVVLMALFVVVRPLWAGGDKSAKLPRQKRLQELGKRGENIVASVRIHRRKSWLGRDKAEGIKDTARDGSSLLISYRNEGLPIPSFSTNSVEKVCIGLHEYFAAIAPLIRDGHIAELEAVAPDIVKHAERSAMNFDLADWSLE